jgi:NAD(P)-dependent dehydrogenase (short-subunit alcohol dehydrogenase family)
MIDLDGKVAIVTGGASGVGEATCHLLAELGAAVTVADVNAAGAERVATEVTAAGGRAIAVTVDVREEDQVEAMVRDTVRAHGGLDILHNNAAALGPDVLGRDDDVLTMTVELWDTTMAITSRGMMLGCKHALPHMLAAGSGAIVNTTSVAGQVGDCARVAYGAAKAGVISLTQYVATMYGKWGIRCNAIAPGLILSPPALREMSQEMLDVSMGHRLLDRNGAPLDIAHAVAFLASDAAAFITGQVLNVDGGVLAHHPTYFQHHPLFMERHFPEGGFAAPEV